MWRPVRIQREQNRRRNDRSDADCYRNGDDHADPDTDRHTEEPTDWEPNSDSYPYGIGESRIERGRELMRSAGYGPNDQFELVWVEGGEPSLPPILE